MGSCRLSSDYKEGFRNGRGLRTSSLYLSSLTPPIYIIPLELGTDRPGRKAFDVGQSQSIYICSTSVKPPKKNSQRSIENLTPDLGLGSSFFGWGLAGLARRAIEAIGLDF